MAENRQYCANPAANANQIYRLAKLELRKPFQGQALQTTSQFLVIVKCKVWPRYDPASRLNQQPGKEYSGDGIRGTVYLSNGGQLTACHYVHEIFAQYTLIVDEKIELGILSPELPIISLPIQAVK